MSTEYDSYLSNHVNMVNKAAAWMLGNDILGNATDSQRRDFMCAVAAHDSSKWDDAEYPAYDAYFYGYKDEDAFNRAWLHHIHRNGHHWQHWVIPMDDGGFEAVEMPEVCVWEMVADWWSFSWASGDLYEVFDWYENHKFIIILHNDTRALVEWMLARMCDVLDAHDGEEEWAGTLAEVKEGE